MSNLNFKWGNHANLPTVLTDQDVGTLFFTKDEGSLYLGVTQGQKPRRIQGVVQYYANLNAFKAEVLPPYSEDVIYYIASENALVKWTSRTAASGNTVANSGEFIVLNVTASEFAVAIGDIANLRSDLGNTTDTASDAAGVGSAFARVARLESAVSALEALTGIGGTGGSLTDKITALEGWRTTAEGQISALEAADVTINGELEGIKGDISGLDTRLGAAEGKITTLEGKVSTAEGKITNLENTDTNHGNRLTTIESQIVDLSAKDATHDLSISSLRGDISQLQTDLGGKVSTGDFNALADRVTAAEGDIDKVEERIGSAESEISNIKTALGTLPTGTTVAAKLESLTGDIATNAGNISTNGDNITTLQGTVGEHTTKIDKNADDIADLKAADEALDGRLDTLESWKTETITDLSEMSGDIANHGTRLGIVEGKFVNYYTKTEANNKHTALENKIANEINAANSLKYVGEVANTNQWNEIKGTDTFIGATYVVTEQNISLDINKDGSIDSNEACYAGDLLIATGTKETNGVLAVADTVWVHVKSGYQKSLQSTLDVVAGAANEAQVQLTSYPSKTATIYGDLGTVVVKSVSNNIAVSVERDDINERNAIQVNLVWDSFDPT